MTETEHFEDQNGDEGATTGPGAPTPLWALEVSHSADFDILDDNVH